MTDTKSGRELKAETGHKGPKRLREFLWRLGIGVGTPTDGSDRSDGE